MRYQAMRGRTCWLCGRNGNGDPLDKHHIFGGSNRKLSEEYGLWVPLCHHRCHIGGAPINGGYPPKSEYPQDCSDASSSKRNEMFRFEMDVSPESSSGEYREPRSIPANKDMAVHRNRETMQKLHEYGQALAMERFGWSIEEFRAVFGRNYLTGEEAPFSTQNGGFCVEEEEPGESFEYSRLAAVLGIRPGDDIEEEDEIA